MVVPVAYAVSAQETPWGTLTGLVVDKDKVGIPGATVTLLYGNGSKVDIAGNPTTTDPGPHNAVGMYTIYHVPLGTYTIRVQAGSATHDESITMNPGTTTKNIVFSGYAWPTPTPSPTSAPTSAPTQTATPTITATPTPEPVLSPTPTATFTSTPTPTPVATPTLTPTPASSPVATTPGSGMGGLGIGLILAVLAIVAVIGGAAYFLFLRKK